MKTLKRLSLLFLSIPVLFIGCNDGSGAFEEVKAGSNKLIGTWRLEATKISPGGPVDWSEVNSDNEYTFKTDGSFSYLNADNGSFSTSGTYSVEGEELLLKHTKDGSELSSTYFMQFDNGKLILQFKGCIEECKERYRRKN